MRVRIRLLLVLVATAVVACCGLGFLSARLLGAAVRESSAQRLEREVRRLLRELPEAEAHGRLQAFAEGAARDLGVRVTLIGDDGAVLADSSRDPATMDNHRDCPEIREAYENNLGQSVRRSQANGEEYYYLARRTGLERAGFLRIALLASDLEHFDRRYLFQLVAVVFGGLLLLGLLAWIVVGRLARPVEEVSEVADRVASGELGADVPASKLEEVSRLAASVNRMKDSLVARLGELDGERKLLRAMTDGLDEGLLLVDARHRILIVNEAFRRIFRLGIDPVGRRVGEVLRNPVVLEQVHACLVRDDDRRTIVQGPAGTNRSFELHVTSVEIPGSEPSRGALVLLFDITRLEALEQARQRFIADVSHELRTPVTSIRGAIETLLDTEGALADDAGARNFLEIARRQADRMGELITDLTDLSRIETEAIALDLREVRLAPLARDVARAVTSRHAGREVAMHVEVPDAHAVTADPRRLEQILINLVDNAVKFTPDGGRVTIRAERRGDDDVVTVEDTGAGIPKTSLDKVFTRFYRVDRARSRELGGTGLGLAIVKHLVKLHRGSVSVESEEGRGSRFVLEFPVKPSRSRGERGSQAEQIPG